MSLLCPLAVLRRARATDAGRIADLNIAAEHPWKATVITAWVMRLVWPLSAVLWLVNSLASQLSRGTYGLIAARWVCC